MAGSGFRDIDGAVLHIQESAAVTTILFLGFLIGMRHALETDHVAAVAVLATRARSVRQALPLGLMWGLGHTLTLFVFGIAILLLGNQVPDYLGATLEGLVGVMLVVLGGDVVRRLIRERIHFHRHRHGSETGHFHAHSHAGEKVHDVNHHSHEHPAAMPLRALGVGIMHGMAGSAALILLTLQTVDSLSSGLLYIVLFGLGSMVGMAALSAAMAVPLRYAARSMTWAYSGLTAVLGLFSMGLGAFTLYQAVI